MMYDASLARPWVDVEYERIVGQEICHSTRCFRPRSAFELHTSWHYPAPTFADATQ